ncbi:OLC1v1011894C2 [Oldenlandia corymbosa var. corymbosa]|uniref:OLC1v1011894C2 n=1 Tax=Oldenlandia corymbosa var. corymbosa TaxID=529605 RepID=A0AAV1DWY8_OLDCO|nr:OLC1v1011894C2 [Oldenlandia corymbosa var. corymbosa]
MPEEDLVELKFRLYDGSDIGPFRYSPASTVAMLKERVLSEWPKDKKIAPKSANDVKLICAGKILENNMTVGQCKMPFGDLPNGGITMHAVVQPSLTKARTEGVLLNDDGVGVPVRFIATSEDIVPASREPLLKTELE